VTGSSLHGGPVGGTWRGDFFTGDFERQVKEGSGDGASLSVRALRGEPGRGAPLLGTSKDMLKKALEIKYLSLCRGFVRGTWRGGGFLYWGL
jgi:hypothetical protein